MADEMRHSPFMILFLCRVRMVNRRAPCRLAESSKVHLYDEAASARLSEAAMAANTTIAALLTIAVQLLLCIVPLLSF